MEGALKTLIGNNCPIIKVEEEKAKQVFRKRGIQQSLSLGIPEGKIYLYCHDFQEAMSDEDCI